VFCLECTHDRDQGPEVEPRSSRCWSRHHTRPSRRSRGRCRWRAGDTSPSPDIAVPRLGLHSAAPAGLPLVPPGAV